MTDNGHGKEIVKVVLRDGKMYPTLGEVNLALLSHAIRLLSLELDNLIVGMQAEKNKSNIEVPQTVVDKMRKGMRL